LLKFNELLEYLEVFDHLNLQNTLKELLNDLTSYLEYTKFYKNLLCVYKVFTL